LTDRHTARALRQVAHTNRQNTKQIDRQDIRTYRQARRSDRQVRHAGRTNRQDIQARNTHRQGTHRQTEHKIGRTCNQAILSDKQNCCIVNFVKLKPALVKITVSNFFSDNLKM
jgi:hypothetical protein